MPHSVHFAFILTYFNYKTRLLAVIVKLEYSDLVSSGSGSSLCWLETELPTNDKSKSF